MIEEVRSQVHAAPSDDLVRERLLTRELYGHLVVLATRPLSSGNRVTQEGSRRSVDEILAQLERHAQQVLSMRSLGVLREMVATSGATAPIRVTAGAVLRALSLELRRSCDNGSIARTLHHSDESRPLQPLKRLLVSIGPTIGVGDELIMANALVDRAARCGVELELETRRPALWSLRSTTAKIAGRPPLALLKRLRATDDSSQTGYVFADFLNSDPCENMTFVPVTAGRVMRWVMGDSSLQILTGERTLHSLRVPNGMPGAKAMECEWVAARVLPATDYAPPKARETRRPVRSREHESVILLQVLTSKPALMLPGKWWAACIQRARQLAGPRMRIDVVSGATTQERELTAQAAAELADALGSDSVRHLEVRSLAGVAQAVAEADVVLGPDTFTAHLAHSANVPQVTIGLREHDGWRRPATRSFYLDFDHDTTSLTAAAGARLALILHATRTQEKRGEFADQGRAWRRNLSRLHQDLIRFVQESELDDANLREILPSLDRIAANGCDILARTLTSARGLGGSLPRSPRREDYPVELDFAIALQSWLHEVGTSDLSAVLFHQE